MFGLVTRNVEELSWPEFDRAVYEVSAPSGRQVEAEAGGQGAISCFADTGTVAVSPELAQVDAEGRRATPDRDGFEYAAVCPSEPEYREGLLADIESIAEVSGDVRLDTVGFTDDGFCRCERCETAFEAADQQDRLDWRAGIVTEFIEQAGTRIPGRFAISAHPDPFITDRRSRTGLDLEAIADTVDEIVVPLYDDHYGTTYWLDAISRAIARSLEHLDMAFGVELYAAQVDLDRLDAAVDAVVPHCDVTYFGYGADNARAVLRRRTAANNDGVVHRP